MTISIIGGQLTTNGDDVRQQISGSQFATVQFTVGTGGTATVTAQVSIDGGVNWIASAYAKRLSTVSANPTVQAITATTLVTGDVWEVPLPGNATHFRLLCAGTGTATAVTIAGGAPYVPGVPVVAVLWDTTAAFAVAINTGMLDLSGWGFMAVSAVNNDSGGTSRGFTVSDADDTGGVPFGAVVTSSVGNGGSVQRYYFGAGAAASGAAANGAPAAISYLSRRTVAAMTAGTGTGGSARVRIEVRR